MITNNMYMFPLWNTLNDVDKHSVRKFEYLMELTEKMLSTFEWEGLPETVPDWLIEKSLLLFGMAGIAKIEDKYYGGFVVPKGTINKEGMTDELQISFLDGSVESYKIEDLPYCWNTKTAFPDRVFLERYSNIFAEIDLSTMLNVIYSRNLPVPIVGTEAEKKQIEEVINNARKGEVSVISADLFRKAMEGNTGNNALPLLELFNPNNTQYSQDLSLLHEELLKRFCNEIGIDISVRDKKAQMNSDEVNAYNDYVRITIEDKLEQRKLFCERLNKKYGLNVAVKLKGYIEDNNIPIEEEGGAEEDGNEENLGADDVQEGPESKADSNDSLE